MNVRAVIHGIVFTQYINYNQSKNDEVASEEGGRAGAGAEGHYHGTEDTRDRVLSEMNLKQHYGTEQYHHCVHTGITSLCRIVYELQRPSLEQRIGF